MNSPKISVIMPAYNHEKYVGEAIESVLNQTFTDFEFIIINDGSTDTTDAVIRSYNDDRIKYSVQENQDAYNAINNGLTLAKGEYVSIINSDDVFHRDRLQCLFECAESGKAIFLTTDIALIGENSMVNEDPEHYWNSWFSNLLSIYETTGSLERAFLAGNLAVTTSNFFFARKVLEEVGKFKPYRYAHDYDYAMRALLRYRGKFKFLRGEKLLFYRIHTGNTISISTCDINKQRFRIVIDALQELSDSGDSSLHSHALMALSELYDTAVNQIIGKDLELQHKDRLIAGQATTVSNLNAQISATAAILKEKESLLIESNDNLMVKDTLLSEIGAKLQEKEVTLAEMQASASELHASIAGMQVTIAERDDLVLEKNVIIASKERLLQDLLNSKSWKITAPLRRLLDLVTYKSAPVQNEFQHPAASEEKKPVFEPYKVRPLRPAEPNRLRVVHALANFMTGGSSRLVVDLIENLGHLYEQEVITSLAPSPPNYIGLEVHEYNHLNSPQRVVEYFQQFRPELVHVHYWGECDKEWYEQIFEAAKIYGCKIIQNINTPVEPYFTDYINSYVYVSNYVLKFYGQNSDKNQVVYPGSDFQLFSRSKDFGTTPDDCIGMVYRLESDKLNERSIDVFVKVAQKRPGTRILIVGGGSYLEPYRNAAQAGGVLDSFTFTGYVSYEDLPKLYEQMSIFVAPVWKESFGQVAPFAMNMGIPVVGYNIGGLSEIIDDKSLLAAPGDSDSLSEMIIALLDDRDRRRDIGSRNRERAQALFSVEVMIESYKNLYGKLVQESV